MLASTSISKAILVLRNDYFDMIWDQIVVKVDILAVQIL